MNRFVRQAAPYTEALALTLAEKLSLHPITARALCLRGVTEEGAAREYLAPSRSALHDPMLLPDMEAALERIIEAVEAHDRICIYGDYDADGVCATAILYRQLSRMGAAVECFVPSRHEDGYGMHAHTVERLCENGIDLIITVDNGITAIDEIALCGEYGVDVIVTDHHIPRETLPDCCAVVAASRKDSAYPYGQLCGAGIAFKLACALADGAADEGLLGLAAVATMADVVPLNGENRAIVQLGTPFVQKNPGLLALLRCAGFDGEPDSQALSFVIAPRLNAAGRMGDASRAIRLLVSEDAAELEALALALQNDNTRRREDEAVVMREIQERFSDEELRSRRCIVLFGAGWNPGVLGIVASRLSERYYKPVILFTEHRENWVGSGRSTVAIHLHDSLVPFRDRFARFGGHARAVGITIAPPLFEAFAADYCAALESDYASDCFQPTFAYEQELPLSELSSALVEELAQLAPFGEGNPEPAFLISDVEIQSARSIGKNGDHLESTLLQRGSRGRLIGFHKGSLAETLKSGERCQMICTLQNDTFRGKTLPELRLVACNPVKADRPGAENAGKGKILDAIRAEVLYNDKINYDILRALFFQLEELGAFAGESFDIDSMRTRYRKLRALFQKDKRGIALGKLTEDLLFALCVFSELGFFFREEGSERFIERIAPGNRQLMDSRLYYGFCHDRK